MKTRGSQGSNQQVNLSKAEMEDITVTLGIGLNQAIEIQLQHQ